jgi:hypothetical protein
MSFQRGIVSFLRMIVASTFRTFPLIAKAGSSVARMLWGQGRFEILMEISMNL